VSEKDVNGQVAPMGWWRLEVLLPGVASGMLGLLVLAGWHTHNTTLVQVHSAFVPMQYNTALGFLLCGTGLLAVAVGWWRTTTLCGGIAAIIGCLTLIEYTVGIDLGIDQFLMEHYITVETSHPGRMAPNTALSFTLTGIVLLLMSALPQPQRHLPILGLLGSIIFALGTVAFFGYVSGITTSYGWGQLTRMAVHTAAGFVVLGIGVIAFAWRASEIEETGVPRWLHVLIGVGVVIISILLWQALVVHERAIIIRAIDAEVANVENEIKVRMESRILALDRMARRWQLRGGTPRAEWEADATAYIAQQPGLLAVEWVDSTLEVRWTASSGHRLSALDLDPGDPRSGQYLYPAVPDQLRHDGGQTPSETPLSRLGIMVTRTIPMGPDGNGFLVYVPLFSGDRFDGFIRGVFGVEELLNVTLANIASGYAISILDDHGFEVYARHAEIKKHEGTWARAREIRMHNVAWRVRSWPTPALLAEEQSRLPEVTLVVGFLTALLLALTVHLAQTGRLRAGVVETVNRELQSEMTERRWSEEELLRRNLELAAIFQASPDLFFWVKSDGTITDYQTSRSWDLSVPPEEFLGKRVQDVHVLPLAIRQGYEEAIAQVIDGEPLAILEYSVDAPAGEKWYEARVLPLLKDQVIIIVRGITERKQAEAQIRNQNILLEEAVHEKTREMETLMERMIRQEKLATIGQIAGSIAHELRNPLGAVKQSIFFLKRKEDTYPEKIQSHLQLMEREIEVTNRVISDLLDMTRMPRPQPTEIDLGTEIRYAVERCELDKSMECKVEIVPDPLLLWADPVHLRQVFVNLLTNTKEAISNGGAVTIRAKSIAAEGRCEITIQDTGDGFDAKNLDKVFEPLYSTKAKGTGLGLSICKNIIESHGGTIDLDNQVGNGTTVSIRLPTERIVST